VGRDKALRDRVCDRDNRHTVVPSQESQLWDALAPLGVTSFEGAYEPKTILELCADELVVGGGVGWSYDRRRAAHFFRRRRRRGFMAGGGGVGGVRPMREH